MAGSRIRVMVITEPEINSAIIRPKFGRGNENVVVGCKYYSQCGSGGGEERRNMDAAAKE